MFRLVAVKKIREAVRLYDEHADDEFEKEVRFMQTMRHPNIVFFFGAGVMDGVPFLVTDFCSRGMELVSLLGIIVVRLMG